ncbi:hypothetical protein MJH12_15165, partial [bacterium]|nr:hypothetical protein [bacterium]
VLADLSFVDPELDGKIQYNGELNVSEGSLMDSLIQISSKDIVFQGKSIPNISTDLHLNTNQQVLVLKKSPILIANCNGNFVLDARIPLNGDVKESVIHLRAESMVLRDIPYLDVPVQLKDLYLSSLGEQLSIKKLEMQLAGGSIKIFGALNPSSSIDKIFQGSVAVRSLNLAQISKELPNLSLRTFQMNSQNQFNLSLQSNLQSFEVKGKLQSDLKAMLLSIQSEGSIDLAVFNDFVKKLGYHGVSGIINLESKSPKSSKQIHASILAQSLSLPVSKDLQNLNVSNIRTQLVFNSDQEVLSIPGYQLSVFGGDVQGKGLIRFNSDTDSIINCKLNNFDLNAFLTWVSKSLGGHFFSKIGGEISQFSFNPKNASIDKISLLARLNLSHVKYIYHQSVLDSIQGIENSMGPKSIRKFIKKKRDGFSAKGNHFILFKDVAPLNLSMKNSLINLLPFQLVQMKDEYSFHTQSALSLLLKEDKLKSIVNGQLEYEFSNTFLKEKFPFLKKKYTEN